MSDNVIIALIAAMLGELGAKVLDIISSRLGERQEELVDTRKTLRSDVDRLQDQVISLQQTLDEWRVKFYALQTQYEVLEPA